MAWRHGGTARMAARLAREVRRTGRRPLMSLPSTPAAFQLLEAYVDNGLPVEVVGHARLAAQWSPALSMPVRTPLALWQQVKAHAELPAAVAVFQDQLVAVDDSYVRVDCDGHRYHVSPIEMMLLMRFKPPVYVGAAARRTWSRRSRLVLRPCTFVPPEAPTQAALDVLMADVLRPLLACRTTAADWLAAEVFPLKEDGRRGALLSQRIQEMEGLVRLCRMRSGRPAALRRYSGTLRTGRLEVLGRTP